MVSTRIITRNLLASAWNAIAPQDGAPVSMSNIEDLSTLLNLCALHDSVVTLGNSQEKEPDKPYLKEVYDALQEIGLEVEFDQTSKEDLAEAGGVRLKQFLRERGVPREALTTDIDKQLKDSLDAMLATWLDFPSDFEEGAKSYDTGTNASPVTNFFLRSFLYWALAGIRERIPLVPDAARSWNLAKLQPRINDDYEQVHSVMSAKYWEKSRDALPGYAKIAGFPAAVVIMKHVDEAKWPRMVSDRKAIIIAITKEVRGRLKRAREFIATTSALREWQYEDENGWTSLNPPPHNPKSSDRVEAEFQEALGEFRETRIALPRQWYTVRPVWQLGQSLIESVEALADIQSPATVVGALGKGLELVRHGKALGEPPSRVADLMEIHHVIGGGLWGAREIKLENIFGSIVDDRRNPLRLKRLWDRN